MTKVKRINLVTFASKSNNYLTHLTTAFVAQFFHKVSLKLNESTAKTILGIFQD